MTFKLVPNWRQLWKSYSVRFAALGLFLPDILQVVADNVIDFPAMDSGIKSIIRVSCLVLVIVSRPIQQQALTQPDDPDAQAPRA